jgi:uncharacterized sulfatase
MRPNILIILTDQQKLDTLGTYGGTDVSTPNIDSLAQSGVRFNRSYCCSAVCSPSRGSIFTGLYPHAHGVTGNNIRLRTDARTIAEVARDEGYVCGYAGKWHLDGPEYPGWVPRSRGRGFEDSLLMFNRGHWKYARSTECGYPGLYADEHQFGEYFELDHEEYSDAVYMTDYLTDVTVEFIENHAARRRGAPGGASGGQQQASGDAPFLYVCSIPDPHQPWCVGPPYDTMFDPNSLSLPETFSDEDVTSEFPFTGRRRERIERVYREMIAEHGEEYVFRRIKAAYLGMVKCIDDKVGRMLEVLEWTGQLDDTIVVFTADHGEYMGAHGLLYKGFMHREPYEVPLLIRYPQLATAGQPTDALVSNIDVMPTLLDLADLPIPSGMHGRSQAPVLRGEADEVRDAVFTELKTHRGIITREATYFVDTPHGEFLFDYGVDPAETRNLAGDAAHRGTRDELRGRLRDHLRECEDEMIKELR